MKRFFGSLFGGQPTPKVPPVITKAPPPVISRTQPGEIYKKGDVIGGEFEVLDILGKGGFGIVYLARVRRTQEILALKTLHDELLAAPAAREAFRREALLWIQLEQHPHIVTAGWVNEVFGRLFVSMEHIAADAQGRVSLADHLSRTTGPIDPTLALKWAIQFCIGMMHATAHGIKCHRDIKPANILITRDGVLKISDFGLAAAAEVAFREVRGVSNSFVAGDANASFGFSMIREGKHIRCGTPGYMAPEVYRCEGADIRSDIYSFGLVMWQMLAGSRVPPFQARWRGDMAEYLEAIFQQQITGEVPRMQSPLAQVVERCLRPAPKERYGGFRDIAHDLDQTFERLTGKKFTIYLFEEPDAGAWDNKGISLNILGRHEEAIKCHDKALAIDPRHIPAWNNKGNALQALGRFEEAVICFDRTLELDPERVSAWTNKGNALRSLGRYTEVLACLDRALAIDPGSGPAWTNKGITLATLNRNEEALVCFDRTLAIDQRNSTAWEYKGNALQDLGRRDEALVCYDKVLAVDPFNAAAWNNKGTALRSLGRHEEAICCYDEALTIDPRTAMLWLNKGNLLVELGRAEEGITGLEHALAIDPALWKGWLNKAATLIKLDRYAEAIVCCDKALAIDSLAVEGWCLKAGAEEALGRPNEALAHYRKFVELASPEYAKQIALAREGIAELEAALR